MLQHKAFSTNKLSTKFCDEHTEDILAEVAKNKQKIGITYPILAYALYTLNHEKKLNSKNIWEQIGYWRNIMTIPFGMNETEHFLTIRNMKNSSMQIIFDGEPYSLDLESMDENRVKFSANQASFQAYISTSEKGVGLVSMKGFNFEVTRKDVLNEKTEFLSGGSSSNEKNLFAPMPGKIIKVNVKAGDKVKRGTVLLVVEAMKMENNIVAESDAVIEKVTVNEGDMVDSDVQLVFLENTENKKNK
jgi:3-methylcrotonyl-CoA carboxylase alpha subunit